ACANAGNPGLCALTRGAVALCADPPDAETRAGCDVLGAYPAAPPANAERVRGAPPPALPPVTLTLDGRPLALAPECLGVLAAAADDAPDARAEPQRRLRYRILDGLRLDTLTAACPAVLAALEQRVGARAAAEPERFWPALTG